MARFVTSLTLRLDLEADDIHAARAALQECRKTIQSALHDRLSEGEGLRRFRIPAPISQPNRAFIEVDDAWLENDRYRKKFQREWEYETREVPITPGSRLTLIHKIALGPKREAAKPESPGDGDV